MAFSKYSIFICLSVLLPVALCWKLPIKMHIFDAVTNVTAGGQPLVWTDNAFFVANITIGTPPQRFLVVVDTASADILVPDVMCDYPTGVCALPECQGVYCNEKCPNKTCCLQPQPRHGFDSNYAKLLNDETEKRPTTSTCFGKRQFNSSASSTYQAQSHVVNFNNPHYGELDGFTAFDTITLGYEVDEQITVQQAGFVQLIQMEPKFGNLTDIDGILGLAFPAASVSGNTPPFIKAVNDGDVADSIFSIWLEDMWQTSDNGTAGVIYYGGYDLVHCSANRTMWPLSTIKYFQFTTVAFSAGSYTSNNRFQTYIDSASMYITVPQQIASQVLNQLGLNVTTPLPPTVPCSTNMAFTFTFPNGGSANIITKNLVIPNGKGGCILAMKSSQNQFILGVPFLRGRCTYFDTTRQLVGTADALSHD